MSAPRRSARRSDTRHPPCRFLAGTSARSPQRFRRCALPLVFARFPKTDKAHLKGDPGPFHIRVRRRGPRPGAAGAVEQRTVGNLGGGQSQPDYARSTDRPEPDTAPPPPLVPSGGRRRHRPGPAHAPPRGTGSCGRSSSGVAGEGVTPTSSQLSGSQQRLYAAEARPHFFLVLTRFPAPPYDPDDEDDGEHDVEQHSQESLRHCQLQPPQEDPGERGGRVDCDRHAQHARGAAAERPSSIRHSATTTTSSPVMSSAT